MLTVNESIDCYFFYKLGSTADGLLVIFYFWCLVLVVVCRCHAVMNVVVVAVVVRIAEGRKEAREDPRAYEKKIVQRLLLD
jgi:hypothetical protein